MKRVLGILAVVFMTTNMFGQATPGMSYQAEVVGISHLLSDPYTPEVAHYQGESYGGGIVFHVDYGGEHGLITAIVSESTRVTKLDGTFTYADDFSDGLGSGRFVAERMIAIKGEGAYDVQALPKGQGNIYGDWFLPTRYDLNLLYLNRAVIGGFSEFAKGWNSIETSSVNAWFHSFTTGARFTNGKDHEVYVRVLRKF